MEMISAANKVTSDVKGSTTAILEDKANAQKRLAEMIEKNRHMPALQYIREFQKTQLRSYARKHSPQYGEAVVTAVEAIVEWVWHEIWKLPPERQAAIDWEYLAGQI